MNELIPPLVSRVPMMQATPMSLLERAVGEGRDIEVIKGLMDLQERWERNEARKIWDDAFASAKAEFPIISKNKHVNFPSKNGGAVTDYWHADLAEVIRSIDPILAKFGLTQRSEIVNKPGEPIVVTTIIAHRTGHRELTQMSGVRDDSGSKNANQGNASTVTYLRRYTLMAACGLASSKDDDDGRGTKEDYITDEQVAEIGRLVMATKTEVGRFCAAMGVDAISDLPASKYELAKGRLKQKERAMQTEGKS